MHEAAWLTDACRHIHRTTSFLPAKRPRSAGRQTRSDTKPPCQRLAKGSWALSPPPPRFSASAENPTWRRVEPFQRRCRARNGRKRARAWRRNPRRTGTALADLGPLGPELVLEDSHPCTKRLGCPPPQPSYHQFLPCAEVGTHVRATVQRTVAQPPSATSGQAVWQRIREDSRRAPTWRNDGGTDRKGETPWGG